MGISRSFESSRKEKGLKEDTSPYPLYQKVKNHIIDHISKGQWRPATKIPSENQLVELLKVSRMTVNRAIRELTSDGFLERVQGVGTFVKPPRPKSSFIEIRNIAEEITQSGGKHISDVIYLAEEEADSSLAHKMEISPGEKVYHSIIVHKNHDSPIQLSDRFVNAKIIPDYIRQDFTQITPHQYLMSIAPIQETEHCIEACLPDPRIQKLLKVGALEPCLLLRRRTWSRGIVVTVNCFTSPSSRYQIVDRIRIHG